MPRSPYCRYSLSPDEPQDEEPRTALELYESNRLNRRR